jgi:hypothetical protein
MYVTRDLADTRKLQVHDEGVLVAAVPDHPLVSGPFSA